MDVNDKKALENLFLNKASSDVNKRKQLDVKNLSSSDYFYYYSFIYNLFIYLNTKRKKLQYIDKITNKSYALINYKNHYSGVMHALNFVWRCVNLDHVNFNQVDTICS